MTARNPHPSHSCPPSRGFTLIEILLVVAIVAVLIALAAPSYRSFVSRAHRTDAIAELMKAAACQERTRAVQGTYDIDRCLPASNDRYRFVYSESAALQYFRLEAAPLGKQQQDPCGTLMLDALGRRSARHPDAPASNCWSGR